MKDGVQETPVGLIEEGDKIAQGTPWCVILYNDDIHTFEEVAYQVQKATGISLPAAFEVTLEVHTKGKAVCFKGTRADCDRVAGILREIQLQVEILAA